MTVLDLECISHYITNINPTNNFIAMKTTEDQWIKQGRLLADKVAKNIIAQKYIRVNKPY